MLGCDETVTLVQECYDPLEDEETYRKTVIHHVSWFSKVKIQLEKAGVVSADLVKIRIPEEMLPPDVVIANQDIIVRGEVLEDIRKPSDLQHHERVEVISVGDNRRGDLRHWAVICK